MNPPTPRALDGRALGRNGADAFSAPFTAGGGESASRIRALSKTFSGGRALDNVSLSLAPGEIHALLGENGSGKSTLIKILSGYHRPDPGGQVFIAGEQLQFGDPSSSSRLGIRFVHQDLGLVESSSILDNLATGVGFPTRLGTIRPKAAINAARAALSEVEVDLDPTSLVSTLSPAQKTSVAVARALQTVRGSIARLLVLDEPTARLPEQEVERLLRLVQTVSTRGVAVLYVTHRLDEVFTLAHTTSVLRDGQKVYEGSVASLTRDELLVHLFGSKPERQRVGGMNASGSAPTLSVDGLGSDALEGVTLQVFPGEVVGIAGITGSGRETLCATIFGARTRDRGTVTIGAQTLPRDRPDVAMSHGCAYIPAERKTHGGFLELTARENISVGSLRNFWKLPVLRQSDERNAARIWFERFEIRPDNGVERPFGTFSGGNQQKLVFGKWFQRSPSLFMLDEPTQGVDVNAKAELHRCLADAASAGAAVLLSSSDTEELTSTCTRVLVMRNGSIVKELVGDAIDRHAIARAALGMSDNAYEQAR